MSRTPRPASMINTSAARSARTTLCTLCVRALSTIGARMPETADQTLTTTPARRMLGAWDIDVVAALDSLENVILRDCLVNALRYPGYGLHHQGCPDRPREHHRREAPRRDHAAQRFRVPPAGRGQGG